MEHLGAGQAPLSHYGVSTWLACISSQHEGLLVVGFLTWWLASKREKMEAASLLKAKSGAGTMSLLLYSVG